MPTESPRRNFLAESTRGLLHMIEMFVHIVERYVDLPLSSLRACSGFVCDSAKPDPAFLFEGQSLLVWKGASSSWILFFTSTTVSQLGANIASCDVNTTTFDSTDCSVSTCSLVWEDRPLSKFPAALGLRPINQLCYMAARSGVSLDHRFFLPHQSLRPSRGSDVVRLSSRTVIVHFHSVLHFASSTRCGSFDTDPVMHVRKTGSVGLHYT